MNPVALGLTIPQPGQPMQPPMGPPGMVAMPGDAEGNFIRLRQLEEQRQNLLLQQQKQQQQLMALAGFGGGAAPGTAPPNGVGAPAQVGSATPAPVPGAPVVPGMVGAPAVGTNPQQQANPNDPQQQPPCSTKRRKHMEWFVLVPRQRSDLIRSTNYFTVHLFCLRPLC